MLFGKGDGGMEPTIPSYTSVFRNQFHSSQGPIFVSTQMWMGYKRPESILNCFVYEITFKSVKFQYTTRSLPFRKEHNYNICYHQIPFSPFIFLLNCNLKQEIENIAYTALPYNILLGEWGVRVSKVTSAIWWKIGTPDTIWPLESENIQWRRSRCIFNELW